MQCISFAMKNGVGVMHHDNSTPKSGFDENSFEIGGKMVIPHSFINKKEPGEIIAVTKTGVTLMYYKGQARQQSAIYTFNFLNNYYGDELDGTEHRKNNPLDDKIPF